MGVFFLSNKSELKYMSTASTNAKGPNTSQWTIMKYLTEVYIPQKQELLGLTDASAHLYRHFAIRLEVFIGRPVKLREIDDKMLAYYRQLTIDQGCTKKTAESRREMLKSVLRHWRPEEHPKFCAQPSYQFLDSDIQGSLEQIFKEHYLAEKPEITSAATIAQYGKSLHKFSMFLGHVATLEDLTDKNLGRFLRHRTESGVKARSANGEAKQIKAIWNWAAKKRLVEQFPTIGKLPEPEIVPKAWTAEQLSKIIATCRRLQAEGHKRLNGALWLAFHLVQWDTGERTGAMRSLTWSMIDMKTGHLTVPAEVRKGGRKAGTYHLKPRTLAALEQARKPGEELLFYFPDPKKWKFYQLYKELILTAGLPYEVFKTGPQKMRRTFASHIAAAGGDATAALRHSTRRVTEDSYLDPAISSPTPPNELLFDL